MIDLPLFWFLQTASRSPASFLSCQTKLVEIGEEDLALRPLDLLVACSVVHAFYWERSCQTIWVGNWRDRHSTSR